MKLRTNLAALLALLALAAGALAFDPTRQPVAPDGTRAVVDLPSSQHMKNVGGSDGAGLCVFTSIQHSAFWQNVRALDGFREWMRKQPGGGWPQKVDKMFAQFCAGKGVPVPPYIQHTGGDAAFLELALKTGRMPGVTYDGRDDFYRGRIAHMVSLAHLDGKHAAIIDNNRPGVWLWMTRDEFLSRWRGNSGGWAVVLLDPPPAPNPDVPQVVFGQRWGSNGCGPVGPLASPFAPAPLAFPVAPLAPAIPEVKNGPQPFGNPPTDRHEWGLFPNGEYGWRLKAEPVAGAAEENFGVDLGKLHDGKSYSINGREVSREEALSVFGDGLKDDSARWNLAAVGDAALLARVKADVAALPADLRDKLHVQLYAPERWEVSVRKLTPGVTLRKPSSGGAAAGDIGTIPATDYTAGGLGLLLESDGGPNWKPKPKPEPKPAPKPGPQPDPLEPAPVKPKPAPAPDDGKPAPKPEDSGCGWCVAMLAALLLALREAAQKKSN